MEQNLALFRPLTDSLSNNPGELQSPSSEGEIERNISSQPSLNLAHPLEFQAILAGISRHAQRIYAQPNGRAEKLEQLANLLVGSATTLLSSAGLDDLQANPDNLQLDLSNVIYFPIVGRRPQPSTRHQLFLEWLFEQLASSAHSIVQSSGSQQESIVQFALFLEEAANSLEEFARRFDYLATDNDWSL